MTSIIKANKGEWSEFYTLLKLLEERKLYSADENLNRIEDIFYPILKITTAKGSNKEISYILENNGEIRSQTPLNSNIIVIDQSSIKGKIKEVFNIIKNSQETTFEIPIAQEILNTLGNPVIKGYNNSKSDIVLIIHDIRTGISPEVGFSIKSKIGGPSTLLNAGETTNFIYEIKEFKGNIQEINAIKSKSKVIDRIKRITETKANFKFVDVNNKRFKENLIKIDSLLPTLLAEMLLIYYQHSASSIPNIIQALEKNDFSLIPGEKLSQKGLYEYKIKHFLIETALGMTPSKEWNGKLTANGGYIIVKEDGDIVCYHVYNRDAFGDYLYTHTKLDTASTTRHNFGYIYEKDNKYYINLNLQIRFID